MNDYCRTMIDKDKVEEQYRDEKNLAQRISIHQKYSVNKEGIVNWLFKQYDLTKASKVLEVGSGTGTLWEEKLETISGTVEICVSDFTEGMVKVLSEKYKNYSNVKAERIDIQDIPFEDNSFDIVIANFMLYHVPKLEQALNEVYRVLKPNGLFYVATVGDMHLAEINSWVKEFDTKLDIFNSSRLSFRLQNGKEILSRFFNKVTLKEYYDHLEVDCVQELLDYIYSFKDMTGEGHGIPNGLKEFLSAKIKDKGFIRISKQSGLFVCWKN